MTDMKKISIAAAILALVLSFQALRKAAAAVSAAAEPPKTEAVSFYFNRSSGEISGLRASGFGYGEIVKIFVIAEMSRRPLEELLAENREGYGWGSISLKMGLNPVFVKLRVDSARRDLDIRVRPAKPEKN